MKTFSPENKILASCIGIALVIFYIDTLIPLGVAGGVPYVLVILISLWSKNKRLPIIMAIVSSILTVLGFYFSPEGGEMWKVISNRLLALFAIWATAVLAAQRALYLNERNKAMDELQVLSGLLPICASCKKIRDDEGHWSEVDVYIRDHSEVKFSHGVCPDCQSKLYPS